MPRTLVLAGAYAGWAGSLPPEAAAARLKHSLKSSDLPPAQFVDAMLPTMFSESVSNERSGEFAASVSEFHPAGFRAMALACADADLRDVLPRTDVPTLLLYGDEDARASLDVAEALRVSIPASRLVVMAGVGHVSNVESPERLNREIRDFLRRNEELAPRT